jgi:mono/diheme cytochrome c family protein
MPYSVNSPQWLDGATAERFIALPADEVITFGQAATMELPNGAVLMQTLTVGGKRVETRLMHKQDNDWFGYSYLWNEQQTDATLVPAGGAEVTIAGQPWHVPTRAECMVCHSRQGNFAIGFTEAQLNREHDHGGWRENQLEMFVRLNMMQVPDAIAESIGSVRGEQLDRLVDPSDRSAPLEARARAYLAGNCAQCHVRNGGGNSMFDVTPWTPTPEMNLIDAKPMHTSFNLPDARLIAPGRPESSVLLVRCMMRGPGQMPPLGTRLTDPLAAEVLGGWISGMKAGK